MRTALEETERRRGIQLAYNEANGIEPMGISKEIRDITDGLRVAEEETRGTPSTPRTSRATSCCA